ncbi:MAG TPA: sigma 54-interacting transcriptional regulator [Terracidiphilus sp.]|nr:sigma 54-interacting transcriptional regulator [Terracidiphilus sp.]
MSMSQPGWREEERDGIGVLLVSPNSRLRASLRDRLRPPRWALTEAASGAEALEYLHEEVRELLVLDPLLPDLESGEFSAIVREQFPAVQVLTVNTHTGILVLGSSSPTSLATQLSEELRLGATDGHPRGPLSPVQLEQWRSGREGKRGIRGMVGDSEAMQRVYGMVHLVAPRDTTVLITGESGTGKDMVAQAIHLLSARQKQPLVVINCAAIPEPLLEAELFGYVKGSFTGAVQSRIGRIHAAHGGTLFLDEIGDMPLALQSKILRFLEQGEVQRIGGNDNLKVDVRVIAATNANLQERVQQKLFREDLYYRLAIFPIALPPLREREGDIPRLAQAFLAKFLPGAALNAGAVQLLESHGWPGNVRELRNVLERSSIFAGEEREILDRHILF